MPEDAPRQKRRDDVKALKATVEAGFRERLKRRPKPGQDGRATASGETVVRLLIEAAGDATSDDALAVRALQELMREKGLKALSRKMLTLSLRAVRGISDSD